MSRTVNMRHFRRDPLPRGAVLSPEVWLVHADAAAEFAEVLDATERRRAAALRRPEDRATYQASHGALRVLAAARLGVDPARLAFHQEACPGCAGPHGRPVISGHPELQFSLSHTGSLALIAFAPVPVGVDVEAVPEPDALRDLTAALHPQERTELGQVDPGWRAFAFTRCWTRKEACLKGTGEGIAGEGFARTVVGVGERPRPVPGWTLTDLRVGEGHAAALAVRDHATVLDGLGERRSDPPHRFS
ncbi:4'-phosphopantetheinyl transferase family protein [Streptomyces cyaneofuscatus]